MQHKFTALPVNNRFSFNYGNVYKVCNCIYER